MPEVTLTFRLEEPVTPEYLAQRVAEACASYGALRRDEAVFAESGRGWKAISPRPVDVGPFVMRQYVEEVER